VVSYHISYLSHFYSFVLTPKRFFFKIDSFRAPYGDIDDRVRAIAWQMGMQNIIWDQDTNDWDMPGDGGGKLAPSTVDGYFQGWINQCKKGTDKTGHIVLEHELNNATVKMTEKWLPQLQQNFNVVSIQQCMNVSQPYWETNWVYPTEANNSTTTVTNTTAASSTVVSSSPNAAATAAQSNVASPAPSTTNIALSAKGDTQSAASINAVSSASLLAVAASCAAYFF
jgi:hypothetical protein